MRFIHHALAGFAIGCVIFAFAAPASALNPAQCRRMCEEARDRTEKVTQSAGAVNAYFACLEKCDRLQAAQDAYRQCYKNAILKEDVERCREQYRHDRPRW